MLKKILIITALLIMAGSSFAQSYPKLSGVQIFVLDSKYNGKMDTLFDGLKEQGVDTVFLRVFHNSIDRYHYLETNPACSTGVYFQTDEVCVVRDVLAEAVESARKHDMKIFAWMATRTLSFLKTSAYMEKTFEKNGFGDGYGMSIFNPEAAEKVRALFRDLAAYDIDGILFQDDFILRYKEGASDFARAAYDMETGIALSTEKLFGCANGHAQTKVPGGCPDVFTPWVKWKNEKMMEFYQSLKIESLKVNPGLVFAGNVYYETPLEEAKGMSWYAQSIDSMLSFGFDYFAVMGYHDQIAGELNLHRDDALKLVEKIADNLTEKVDQPSRILMKVQRVSFAKDSYMGKDQLDNLCEMFDRYTDISRVIVPVNKLEDIYNKCLIN